MICSIRGHDFELHHSRCLIWPQQKLLVVADIHLGKAQTFQQSGLWLPQHAHRQDLEGLHQIIHAHEINHVLFLGDFIHSTLGVTSDVVHEFTQWKDTLDADITVVIGNHDRPMIQRWPKEWQFVNLVDQVTIDEFKFQHEPPAQEEPLFTWCGHIHPKINLRNGPEKLYLPAFVVTKNVGYLPAYSSLAGGANFTYSKKNRYFVPNDREVVEVIF